MRKTLIFISILFIASCVNEISLKPSNFFSIENIQVEVDKFENELFLQAEIDYWNEFENIVSVQAELSVFQNGGYESLGSFDLYDNGKNGDIIPENGIYSLLTTAEELIIVDVEPEIKSINMASHYELAQSESDSLSIELTVSGKSLRVTFTAEDIEGVSTQFTKYINLSNSYIEIQFNDFGMLKDSDDDGIVDILDVVNFIYDILGDSLTRSSYDLNKVNLSYSPYSIVLEEDSFVGLDIVLEYQPDIDISFNITNSSIVSECISISDTRSECIIATDQAGEILSANGAFKIVSIIAAIPGGYVNVGLSEIPMEFSIGEAYPNPFNPVVQFDYTLPIKSNVMISVYDINGRVVSILENNIKDIGEYNIVWEANNFSSGAYFIQCNINNVVSTQKIMLIK